MTELNLSDKEIPANHNDSSEGKYRRSDVKEAIKLLKEDIENHRCAFEISGKLDNYSYVERKLIVSFINKRFGSKLTGEKT